MWRLLPLLLALALPAHADTNQVTFAPSDADIANPERGWWLFSFTDFATATEEEFAASNAKGVTLVYGLVRLDDYRSTELPDVLLTNIQRSFDLARAHGLKVILRFAYNYPGSSFEYENAEDAPLPLVLRHIEQLAPVIAANADTIVVMQGGFIGAWGEAHTSSNGLDSPDAKAAIRDALYAAVPASIPLQWRYPPDILSWPGDTRMGFRNDCFLSSETDVGTYDEDPTLRDEQRAAMMARTADHFFSGEVCDADAAAARKDCASILAEGAAFHLSSLNLTYYEAFHNQWKAEGCFAEITMHMGYRLSLVSAKIDEGSLKLTVQNHGWVAPIQARSLLMTAYQGDAVIGETTADRALDAAAAGQTTRFEFPLPGIRTADRICISAPDSSPRLADDTRYTIQFANADQQGQAWDQTQGAFCFSAR